MKRFAVTGFAILYALLVFGISASRTSVWVEANARKQKTDQADGIRIGKPEPFSPHFSQKRIPQNQFVVESPWIASGALLQSNPHVALPMDVWSRGQSVPGIPSRAPPSLS